MSLVMSPEFWIAKVAEAFFVSKFDINQQVSLRTYPLELLSLAPSISSIFRLQKIEMYSSLAATMFPAILRA
jgi:hypothetical protein